MLVCTAPAAGLPSSVLAVLALAALGLVLSGCSSAPRDWSERRQRMVEDQIVPRGVKNPRILEAMRRVPRHLFVPEEYRDQAYGDHPLPIGSGQTISQPYIVAVMTELLDPEPDDVVLEIGSGSGYQAAVLAELVKHVYTIEIIPELAEQARRALADTGYENVTVVTGDGYRGLPEQAPFDGIVVTAAPPEIPRPLYDQLAVGGRLVVPLGNFDQDLVVVERTESGFETQTLFPVRFVPMTGRARGEPGY